MLIAYVFSWGNEVMMWIYRAVMWEGKTGEGLGYKVVNAEGLVEGSWSYYHWEECLPMRVAARTCMLPIH